MKKEAKKKIFWIGLAIILFSGYLLYFVLVTSGKISVGPTDNATTASTEDNEVAAASKEKFEEILVVGNITTVLRAYSTSYKTIRVSFLAENNNNAAISFDFETMPADKVHFFQIEPSEYQWARLHLSPPEKYSCNDVPCRIISIELHVHLKEVQLSVL